MIFKFTQSMYDEAPEVRAVVWYVDSSYDLDPARWGNAPDGFYGVDTGEPDWSRYGWQVHYCLEIVKRFIRLQDENKV